MPIGTASPRAAPTVPAEVRSLAPVIGRTTDIRTTNTAAATAIPRQPPIRGSRRGRRPSASGVDGTVVREAHADAPAAGEGRGCRPASAASARADVALLGDHPVPADELVGDDHRQHDDALGDLHDLLRDVRRG